MWRRPRPCESRTHEPYHSDKSYESYKPSELHEPYDPNESHEPSGSGQYTVRASTESLAGEVLPTFEVAWPVPPYAP